MESRGKYMLATEGTENTEGTGQGRGTWLVRLRWWQLVASLSGTIFFRVFRAFRGRISSYFHAFRGIAALCVAPLSGLEGVGEVVAFGEDRVADGGGRGVVRGDLVELVDGRQRRLVR